MDSKEQIIVNLKKENEFLKRENDFLKREFMKITGSYPNMDGMSMMGYGSNVYLPPINNFKIGMDLQNPNSNSRNDFDVEIKKLKEENILLKKNKETYERQNINLINENSILAAKLNNLENVFIGSSIVRSKDGTIKNDLGEDYNTSAVKIYFYFMIF
jgi:cell division protein FtsB